jgi:hypothetical protein
MQCRYVWCMCMHDVDPYDPYVCTCITNDHWCPDSPAVGRIFVWVILSDSNPYESYSSYRHFSTAIEIINSAHIHRHHWNFAELTGMRYTGGHFLIASSAPTSAEKLGLHFDFNHTCFECLIFEGCDASFSGVWFWNTWRQGYEYRGMDCWIGICQRRVDFFTFGVMI